jgi:hypothetical protein
VTQWIAEVQASRAVAQTTVRKSKEQPAVMTREEISVVINQLGDIRTVIADADPDDKARVYQELGLKLTYQPGKRTTRAEMILDPWGYRLCPRGDLSPRDGEISPDWGSHTRNATTRAGVIPLWYGVHGNPVAWSTCVHCGVFVTTLPSRVAGVLTPLRIRVLASRGWWTGRGSGWWR